VSSDRDTRARLEQVQTKLRELEPELGITETPGHAEKLAELQKAVREARHRHREALDRLNFTYDELRAARRAVDDMHLFVQAQQTNVLPALLTLFLGPAAVVATVAGVGFAVVYGKHYPELMIATAAVSSFCLGLVVRARVMQPKLEQKRGQATFPADEVRRPEQRAREK
jgi:hypothetical protein